MLEVRRHSGQSRQWIAWLPWLAGAFVAVFSRQAGIEMSIGLLLSAVIGWLVHFSIKSRRQARLLDASASRLSTLLENLPGMAYRCLNEENWSMEFVSEGCQELTGYDKADLEQRRVVWNQLIHPQDRERIWDSVQDAVVRGEPFELEYRLLRADGTTGWVWERGSATGELRDGVAFIEGLITDITQRKLAEAELVNAEAYAKAVVDTAAEAVITIDAQGLIESFNSSASRMFGHSADEVLGLNVQVLMPDPYRHEHDQYIAHYLDCGEAKIIGKGRHVTAVRKDGSEFPIHLSVSEVFTADKRSFVGLIRDLSEQRAAEQDARENREKLAHVDRLNLLGEMATGIAHEINQPLSAISMYAQSGLRFLDATPSKPERLREALQKLSAQAHRAGAVIERVQLLSKQRISEREEIDLNQLVREVRDLGEIEARIRDMDIDLDLCDTVAPILGDPIQLQQVVLNLVRNGLESLSNNENSTVARLVVKTQDADGEIVVSVADNGTGVSEDVAEKLFQPFASTKHNGMGMGLSICKSIVSAHGGQLGFFNNDMGGATFYVSIPHLDGEIA